MKSLPEKANVFANKKVASDGLQSDFAITF